MPKKIVIGILVFIVIYTVFGFFILPSVLKSILTKKLTENLHRTVSIEDIKTNPYIISAKVKGLVIKDQQNQDVFASIAELYINAQIESLPKKALVIKEISVSKPYVNIIHKTSQQYNFSDLIQESGTKEDTKKEPFRFFLANIQVSGGQINFLDLPKNKQHKVTDISFALPFLSNMHKIADIFVQPYFRANINGTPLVIEGKSKPFAGSLETVFNINLKGIEIPYYMDYLPKGIEVKVPSGTLDAQANISYIQPQNKSPAFHVSGTLGLNNLKIYDTKDLPLVFISGLSIKIADIALSERNAHLSFIDIASPELYIRRDKSGDMNLNAIIRKIPAKETEAKTESQPFPIQIDQVKLKSGNLYFLDESTSDPVNLAADNLNISANNIDITKGGMAELSCRLNRKSIISTKAIFETDPLKCEAEVSIEGIEPAWVQSYFTDHIRIIITKGRASTKGTFTMKQDNMKRPQISYTGSAVLSDFASVDKENKDDFFKINTLNLNNLDAGFNPTYVDIKEIFLKDFFAGIVVNADGSLNINNVVKQDQNSTIPKKEGDNKSIEKIMIGKVSINNGNISFVDRNINPNFSTKLANIKGSITGLTSRETEAAKVELSGKLENTSPLSVTGSINPLKDDLFVDLHTSFKDIDLSSESPYSGKYIGYTINKGKLSLNLKYLINKKKLDSQNDVFIDQFTFGNSVDSPDATSLPVSLAVSLLKDYQGKINLTLPVSGRTDDPEFSVWKVIVKMLINLVGKAATSPFSLLASLYPGADQLSNVTFDFGSADLSPQSEDKLQLLTKILTDKPSVSLEVKGYADKDKDRQAIIQYLFEKKLKARKLIKMIKSGQPAIEVDKITISPDEYELYLKEAYQAETLSKPKNTKNNPAAPEMKKLIIDHIQVTESDLKFLAEQRARQVKNFLIESQQINSERIFLVEAEIKTSEGSGSAYAGLNLK